MKHFDHCSIAWVKMAHVVNQVCSTRALSTRRQQKRNNIEGFAANASSEPGVRARFDQSIPSKLILPGVRKRYHYKPPLASQTTSALGDSRWYREADMWYRG